MNCRMTRLLAVASAAAVWGAVIVPASAAVSVVDNFNGDTVDAFPAGWTLIDNAQSTTPRVRNDGNGVDGNYLEFSSPYYGDAGNAFETIGLSLPTPLTHDGDYIQLAMMLPSSSEDVLGAWLLMNGGPYPGGSVAPAASMGMESVHHVFDYGPANTVYSPNTFGTISMDVWYYLRATMRDNGGVPGVIDSYDFQVFSDAAGTQLIAQQLGIDFVGGEGDMRDIALRTYPQSGDPFGVALFDEITENASVPEPGTAVMLLLGLSSSQLIRRRHGR